MKKLATAIFAILLMSFGLFSVVGCTNESEHEEASRHLDYLITAIDHRDKVAVKSLFAKCVLSEVADFDNSIDALLEYYQGDFVSRDNLNGLGTDGDIDNGVVKKIYNISNDVTTTKGVFRFAIYWRVKDTGDEQDTGILSFYILKFEDDHSPSYAYRGDGNWTKGINIAKNFEDALG